MDENLTRREKLVSLAVDLHTKPDHHLVVFKKVGENERKFRSIVAPGQIFKRKFLESSDSFIAYNVPCDKNLRHQFSKKVLMLDNTRSFTLRVTLFYGIENPRILVERVERDPLRRVQDEAIRILAGRASRLDWEVVEKGDKDFESLLRQNSSGSPDSALEQIQRFALDQGIKVANLGLGRSLPEDATSQCRREIDAQDRFHAENVEHALRIQKAENEAERNELKTFSTARDAMANRAAADIKSFSGMQRALQDWNKIRGSGMASESLEQGSFGGGPPPTRLPGGDSGVEIRYTDISSPREVWQHTHRFTVVVRLTVKDAGLSAATRALELATKRPVHIHLHAPAFDLLGESVQEVKVESNKDSPPVVFDLKPRKTGQHHLLFDFFQGGQPLGTVSVPVEVTAERLSENQQVAAGRALYLEADALAPDRVMLVQWDPRQSALSLNLIEEGGVSWRQFTPIPVEGDLARWAGHLFQDLTTLTDSADPSTKTVLRQRRILSALDVDQHLKMLGLNLWRLFPTDFRQLYSENRERWRNSSLLILSDEPFLPWELVWPYGESWEDEEPWCLSMRLSRWLRRDAAGKGNPHPPGRLRLTSMACLAPSDSGLQAAKTERTFLRDLIQNGRLRDVSPPRATWRATMDFLEKGGYDWLHVAAHGNFYAPSPDEHAALWMEGRQALAPRHFVGPRIEEHLRRGRPTFFMNTCDAGRLGWSWNGLEGWADRLLTLGAGMFLGPLWAAEDDAALTLAQSFYAAALAGETVAEALRQARRAARRPGSPTWSAYSLYAHPNARLCLEHGL